MLTFLALAHMLEKKDASDSLLKFKRALNADATLFLNGFVEDTGIRARGRNFRGLFLGLSVLHSFQFSDNEFECACFRSFPWLACFFSNFHLG